MGGTNGKYVWRRWQGVCGRHDRYDRWVLVIAFIVTVGRRGGVRCRYMRLLGSARHVAFGSVSAVPEGSHSRVFLSHGRFLSAIRGPDTCSRVSEMPSCGSRGMPELEMGVLEHERRTMLILRTGSAIVHVLVVRFPGSVSWRSVPFFGARLGREKSHRPPPGAHGGALGAQRLTKL